MKKIWIIGILLMMGVVFHAEAQSTWNDALRLLEQKNYIAAMDVCDALLAESANNASVLGVRSQIHTATGKYNLALQDADKAISIDKNSDRALFAKAEALLYGQKDFKQALLLYDAAIKSNAQMTEAYAGRVRAYIGMQNFKEALKVVEDAIKTFRNDAELYFLRGYLNFQRGVPKLAIDDYDRSLALNTNWNAYQLFFNRGLANDALSQHESALQDFTKSIAADPNNAGGYIYRGNMLYNLARYSEAVEDFMKAEVLSPDNSSVTYNIGMAYLKNNDKASACKYFQKSCSQGNNNACRMAVVNCSDRKTN